VRGPYRVKRGDNELRILNWGGLWGWAKKKRSENEGRMEKAGVVKDQGASKSGQDRRGIIFWG